jgi:hypothetical protein
VQFWPDEPDDGELHAPELRSEPRRAGTLGRFNRGIEIIENFVVLFNRRRSTLSMVV